MTDKTQTTTVEEIEAYVEGYRGSRDAPGFDACVKAEINARLARYEKALRFYAGGYENYSGIVVVKPELAFDNGETARNALEGK